MFIIRFLQTSADFSNTKGLVTLVLNLFKMKLSLLDSPFLVLISVLVIAAMAKTIILTGATGLIGSSIFEKLIQRGDRVIIFARNPDTAKEKLPNAASYVRWDAEKFDEQSSGNWRDSIGQADAVIHLAGVPVAERWNDGYKKRIYDSRVLSTRSLVSAIEASSRKPNVFISASGIGYYGIQPQQPDVPELTETSPAATDFLATVCVDWENEALKAETFGVRTVVIRTGVVLSTKGGALEKMLTPFKLFAGGPVGSGRQWVSWIHLDDEVAVFLYALDNPDVHGALNATAPQAVTMSDLASSLGKALSRPSLFPVPKAALQLLFGEAADVVAEGQRVAPKRLTELGFRFSHQEVDAALKDLLARSV